MVATSGRKVTLLDPRVSPRIERLEMAPRLEELAGRRLALLENTKPHSATVLRMVGDLLQDRYGVEVVELTRKPSSSRVAPEEMLDRLARYHAVVVGVGD